MSGKAVIVIDVQNCFLPGGSLATMNSRNSEMMPASTLGKSIAKFVNGMAPEHLFVSKDYHTPGHTSFLSENDKTAGMMTFPNAAGKGEYAKGIAAGRYSGRSLTNPRYWGTEAERFDQKLWPEHCVQGTPGADVDAAFDAALNPENKAKAVTILKGDTADIDSYSVIADALGNFTPHDEQGRTFISILQESNISEVFVTGIARDVCVFWSALDILNYWILPAYKAGKVIKLVFMYDLTRPVSSVPGAPYTDKTVEQVETAAKELIAAMGLGPEVYEKVFEVRTGGYGAAGGSRTKTMRRNGVCKKNHTHRNSCNKRGGSKTCTKNHTHNKSCNKRGGANGCSKNHKHTKSC
jgi:nicotinamidase-related amidase